MGHLKATCRKPAFLVNFGHYPKAQIERIVFMNFSVYSVYSVVTRLYPLGSGQYL